ncbi:MAG TPA: hypothetical protein VHV49_19850 [Pseudonocardiaceae bacterium]|nr:hypothetical protein [Pseudonocardiaceae bacterium]
MKVDLVAGVTPVPIGSVADTAAALTRLITECRGETDLGVPVAAREAAEIVHRASAGLVAVVRQPKADPALLVGVLAATAAPLAGLADATDQSDVDIRETVAGRTPLGYPVVFAERVVSAERLKAGEPFDCQLQAVVADPDRPRLAVFTLSSTTGRGWLAVSAVFGRLVASIDFRD